MQLLQIWSTNLCTRNSCRSSIGPPMLYCKHSLTEACVVSWQFISDTFSWFGIAILVQFGVAVITTIAENKRLFHLHRDNAITRFLARSPYATIIWVRFSKRSWFKY